MSSISYVKKELKIENKVVTYLQGLQLFCFSYSLILTKISRVLRSPFNHINEFFKHSFNPSYHVLVGHAPSSHNVSVCHVIANVAFDSFWFKMSLAWMPNFIVNVSGHLGVVFEGLSTA